ncbi:MAG: ACT domain-containing protein [Nonomuraea sp.]|nr:ACT domain-containing protein [Nonomuraea sp.]NUP64774.1 ACT domain-containing protein [Nonomuraea sp.]NUP77579.1 ACT domain-containing protein [Nonomuraea sp.]NUS03943.1 ACT domain-containing protein [Nonomuraea sp.]NUT42615.1 ACT domain-containing protein [Thermoactinospora sp.]
MLLRVRVALPDRPGSLAQVTRALGTAGADITQVTVLDRGAGTAVDDITVFCPESVPRQALVKSLETVDDVRVESVWSTREAAGTYPELEILKYITTAGERALTTLVDSLPVLFSADWAATAADQGILYASWRTPQGLVMPAPAPPRPAALTLDDGVHAIHAPLPPLALTLLLARSEGPAFHRTEVHRLTRILEIFLSLPATERSIARQLRA